MSRNTDLNFRKQKVQTNRRNDYDKIYMLFEMLDLQEGAGVA